MGISVVDIVIENRAMHAVELLVFGKRFAETIVEEAKRAGFGSASATACKESGDHAYRVSIARKSEGGRFSEVIAFLEEQAFEFGMDR